jgi:hypothetical protein
MKYVVVFELYGLAPPKYQYLPPDLLDALSSNKIVVLGSAAGKDFTDMGLIQHDFNA